MCEEIWKDIKGFEGKYQVSSYGRVKSLVGRKERLLKQQTSEYGYKYVVLRVNKLAKVFFIHKEVLKSFVSNHKCKKQGNHINGIKTDNRLSNLEWCNPSENIKHAFDNGLVTRLKGSLNTHAKLSELDVKEIRSICSKEHKNYKSIAKRYDISVANVSAIVLRKSWKHI